ncbi:MAG TPA: hypothetical protein VMT18_14630 [Planctomycetota bacterium]|nr:hypothetical protein [Planctomycetota bacterium]
MSMFLRPLLAALPFCMPALAQRGPLPVEKTATLRDDLGLYTVEGRQRIRGNVKLKGLRACTIQGVGEGAVLEVEGLLDLRAATGGEVVIEGVWIEPLPGCKGISLRNTRFEGEGGIRTHEGEPVDAEVLLEATHFRDGSRLDLALIGGGVELLSCASSAPVALRGLTGDKQKPNRLRVEIKDCAGKPGGLAGGLEVRGVHQVAVRHTNLGGELCLLADNGELEFYGNLGRSQRIEFRQSEPGSFRTTKIGGTDFSCRELLLIQPAGSGDPEKARLDNCWFDDRVEPADIKEHQLSDFERDPTNGVLAIFARIQERPLGYAAGG